MAKELRLVIDVALCLRAWKKVARRQRQKREKAALSAPPPLDEPLEKILLRAFEVLKFQTRGI